MAIYRPPKSRWPLALGLGVAGLLVGFLAGFALKSDPSASESADQIRTKLISAAGSLEVAAIEYEESVDGGEVVAEAEYRGALDAVASARAAYDEVGGAVAVLSPERDDEIAEAFAEVTDEMESEADPSVVVPLLEALAEKLKE